MVCPAGSYVTVLYGVHPSVPCARCFFLQHMPSPYHSSLFCCSTSTKIMSSIPDLPRLITWKSVFYLNARHPSDYSHLCSLKCHLIFFPYRPGLTYVPIKLVPISKRHFNSQYQICLLRESLHQTSSNMNSYKLWPYKN